MKSTGRLKRGVEGDPGLLGLLPSGVFLIPSPLAVADHSLLCRYSRPLREFGDGERLSLNKFLLLCGELEDGETQKLSCAVNWIVR